MRRFIATANGLLEDLQTGERFRIGIELERHLNELIPANHDDVLERSELFEQIETLDNEVKLLRFQLKGMIQKTDELSRRIAATAAAIAPQAEDMDDDDD